VVDSEVSSTYDRRQIVVKTSENQIMFDYDNLWADRLPNALANLVHRRIASYNLVNRVVRDYHQPARFEVATHINNIEFLKYGRMYAARLNMEMQLRRTSDNLIVFSHSSDRIRQIYIDNSDMFIQTINDLLMEETDIFLLSLIGHMEQIERGVEYSERILTSRDFLEDQSTLSRRMEQIEEEQITFTGRLFVPSRTDPDQEPLFIIEDLNKNYIGSYPMGSEVHLLPGMYNILLGNGTTSQKVVETVQIFQRYKTFLDPDVGWLIVNVINNSRNQMDQRYELFDLNTGESYGFGYGVKEGVGQQLDSWVLRPGHYKIVLNGLPFNSYEDFVTVEVKKSEVEQLTIVVDEVYPHRLMGAGRLLTEDFLLGTGKTSISIMNHLNANFMSRNDVSKNKNNFSLIVTEQLDTKLVMDYYPIHYTMKNLIELGISKDSDTDLKKSNDKFDLKNTFIYYFMRNLGIYARADLNTHLFPEFVYTKDKKDYLKIRADGTEKEVSTDRLLTKNSFTPLTLKEGVGVNYRVINANRANLNLRAGLGLRQDFHKNAFYFDRADSLADGTQYDIYRELPNAFQRGIEFSSNGHFQILRNLNYTMNFDMLLPFGDSDSANYEMENIFNLRMFRHISWDYRVNLSYNERLRDYLLIDHTLFLRLTYIFIR
jgi:hypothetical protein